MWPLRGLVYVRSDCRKKHRRPRSSSTNDGGKMGTDPHSLRTERFGFLLSGHVGLQSQLGRDAHIHNRPDWKPRVTSRIAIALKRRTQLPGPNPVKVPKGGGFPARPPRPIAPRLSTRPYTSLMRCQFQRPGFKLIRGCPILGFFNTTTVHEPWTGGIRLGDGGCRDAFMAWRGQYRSKTAPPPAPAPGTGRIGG